MLRNRSPARRRSSSRWSTPKFGLGVHLTISSRKAAEDARSGGKARITFTEVMRLYDEAFVKAAYLLILGRVADPNGLEYYAGRLRRGYSRISVLDQLTKSSEALEDWKKQPGLDEAIKRFRTSRRLKGWRLALTDTELGRTPSLRRARVLQNSVAGQRHHLEESLAKLSEQHEVVRHMVTQLGHDQLQSDDDGLSRTREGAHRRASRTPHLRSRRLHEIRSMDLSSSARSVLDDLQF